MTIDTGASAPTGLDPGSDRGAQDEAGAKARAQEAATTAADETKHVAGVAAGEAKNVAAEATSHARDLVGEARGHLRGQIDDQGRAAKDQVAGTLGTLGEDLTSMAENSSGLAADLTHEVADRARALSRHLEGRQPDELLDDVRRFARNRPGMFLVGALAAGVVVGRLARGAKDAIDAAEGESQDSDAAGTPSEPGAPSVLSGPQVTSGAPDISSVQASPVQPTQPPVGDPVTPGGLVS